MLSLEQPKMHHNQRDTNRLKTFKLLGNQSDFFRLFFLNFLEIVHSGSGVIQLLHVRITTIGHFGSFQRPLHTCTILYDHSTMNDQSAKQCDWDAIDFGIVYYYWILLASKTDLFPWIGNVPNSAIERPIAILQCSHLKLETTWLSLASWDISASYFSSRPRIRIISSLHSSRSCESDTKHQHQKKWAGQPLRIASIWTEIHESEWEFTKIRTVLTWSADIAQPKGYQRLKAFKLLRNPNDFFKLFFLSFLEIVRPCSGVIQLLHVRIIHKTWASWELQKAFAHMYDIDWYCIMHLNLQ